MSSCWKRSVGLAGVCLGIISTLFLIQWELTTNATLQTPGVELGPDHTRQAEAGETILYRHILTNTNTMSDTFLLEVLSTQNWPVELLDETHPSGTAFLPLQVGSGVTASFQVSLTVPVNVAGVTENTIVTATSQLSPTVKATALDKTVVYAHIYLPLVLRIPPEPNLFLDMNGNGLYDTGEPGLADFAICVDGTGQCTTTDRYGRFSLPATLGGTVTIAITDPNVGDPALAMRYINKWNGPVVIPAYEVNGVAIPEQHLNDTEIVPIGNGVEVVIVDDLQIGLMQGFLTLPFIREQVQNPFVWNFYDLLNPMVSCDSPVPKDDVSLNYDGMHDQIGDPFLLIAGVGDSHTGLDYAVDVGNFVVHAAPTSRVFSLAVHGDGEILVHTLFADPSSEQELMYKNTYAHLGAQLVELDQTVHRGQIIALSGDSGTDNTFPGYGSRQVPQLHFDLSRTTLEKCTHYLDPYRYTLTGPFPDNFSGSSSSYWTVDNDPQFSR